MRSTGIVREVDSLGRIVLPIELRRVLDIDARTPLGIFTEGNSIVLRKHEPGCVICGMYEDDIQTVHGKPVCSECRGLVNA